MLSIFGGFLLLLSIVGALYGLIAAVVIGRYKAPADGGGEAVPLTILKPLHGDEPGLRDNFETFMRQDYAGPVQIVFGVHDASDSAIAVAEALRRDHADADIALVIDPRVHGANGKISNLINMMKATKYPLLVLSDSDIAVPADYLRRVTHALAQPRVGAVTCFYRGVGRAGFPSRLAALGINWHFLPDGVTAHALGLAKPCMGSTIAIERPLLEQLGGFEAFADVLADDYEIGRAVRARGLKVAIPPFLVTHGCAEKSLSELIAHELRWLTTIRRIDPLGYAGAVVLHPLPLAFAGAAFSGFAAYSVGVLIAVAIARYVLGARMCVIVGRKISAMRLLVVRDMLSFVLFFATFLTRSVDWRGARFTVSRQGQLSVRRERS